MKLNYALILFCLFSTSFFVFAGEHEGRDPVKAREAEEKLKELDKKVEEKKKKVEEERKKVKEEKDEKLKEEYETEERKSIKDLKDLLEQEKQPNKQLDEFGSSEQKEQAKAREEGIKKEQERIVQFEQELAQQGIPVNTEEVNLSLGQRLGKNLEAWKNKVLAKVYESLGDYAKAKTLRDNLVTLYSELRNPIQKEINILAAERLSVRLGEIPARISKNIDGLNNYLQRLDDITTQKNEALKKSTKGKETIEREAQNAIKKAATAFRLSEAAYDILETTLKLQDQIADETFKKSLDQAGQKKLATIQEQLDRILVDLDAKSGQFASRSERERELDKQNQDKTIKSLFDFSDYRKNFDDPRTTLLGDATGKKGTLYGDLITAEKSPDYKKVIDFLDTLESLDRDVLSPEDASRVASILSRTYGELAQGYRTTLENETYRKRLNDNQRSEIFEKNLEFLQKAERAQHELQQAFQRETELARQNVKSKVALEKMIEENKNAKVMSNADLDKAGTEIGTMKNSVDEALSNAAANPLLEKLETLATVEGTLSKRVEDLLVKIDQAASSQESLNMLERLSALYSDIIDQLNSLIRSKNLSEKVVAPISKTFADVVNNFREVNRRRNLQLAALTQVVGNNIAELPQITPENEKKYVIPPAPELPPAQKQVYRRIKDAGEQARKAVTKVEERSLADVINSAINARRKSIGEGGESGEEEPWNPDNPS